MALLPVLLGLLATNPAAPPELGRISWLRDLDAGLASSKESGKPVLLLFDEVPGCQTVLRYGREVLSHPQLVKLAEREFVPVAIFNNVGGLDREVLESFREPAWNNPVVRIIDHRRRPLAPRVNGDYSLRGLASAMVTALEAAEREVPSELRVLAGLAAAPPVEQATFSMHCFWECEARLAGIEGVVAARVGFLHGEEVVEVAFDPAVLERKTLIARASELDCARTVFSRSDREHEVAVAVAGERARRTDQPLRRSTKDEKYYLARSKYRNAGLSELEALRVNAALRFGRDPEAALRAVRAAR